MRKYTSKNLFCNAILIALAGGVSINMAIAATPGWGYAEIVSTAQGGAAANNHSYTHRSKALSADGRFVVFSSDATNLLDTVDSNGRFTDVFLRDRQTGVVEMVSVDSQGKQSPGVFVSDEPSISLDGHFVAFKSYGPLVASDTNHSLDIYLRDRLTGTTQLVSVNSQGELATGGGSERPSISGDGRYVVFESTMKNLVPGDTNGVGDIFLRDIQQGTTKRISVSSSGVQANAESRAPNISADGRYVVYHSYATNLIPGVGNYQVYRYDIQTGKTELVSVIYQKNQNGSTVSMVLVPGDKPSSYPQISGDGRYVVFGSQASNLVRGAVPFINQIYLRDMQKGTMTLISQEFAARSPGNQGSEHPVISGDGRYIAFASFASNLVPDDTNKTKDIFRYDTQTREMQRINVDELGTQGTAISQAASISYDGSTIGFASYGNYWTVNKGAKAMLSNGYPASDVMVVIPASSRTASSEF